MNKENLLISLQYIAVILLLFCLFIGYSGIMHFNLYAPLVYPGGDAAANYAMVKLIASGQYFHQFISHVGYMGGFIQNDYPSADTFSILQIILIAKIFSTQNPFFITNVFYLLSYVFAAWTSLFVLKHCGIKLPLAIAGAMLFTLQTYHFYHGEEHLFLSSYFCIPLWILLCIDVYINGEVVISTNKRLNNFWIIILLLLCSTNGVYYAFFGSLFLFTSGLLGWVRGNKRALFSSTKLIILTVIILIAQILPTILNNNQEGANVGSVVRSALQTQYYGLRISQLLLPANYHRVSMLGQITQKYNQVFYIDAYSSQDSHLGIVAAIGFILLVLLIFFVKIAKDNKVILLMRDLNVVALLYALQGGFAVLFSYFIMDEIRSVVRISIFIAFFAIISILLILQNSLSKYKEQNLIFWLLGVMLIYIAAFDQIDQQHFNNQIQMLQVFRDQSFIQKVERSIPQNSAIFQLPYLEFPEPSAVSNYMSPYEQFIPYLYSRDLYWSYGATKGRSIATWDMNTAILPPLQMIDKLILAGYSGLLIDNAGYKDANKEILQPLTKILNVKPMNSADNHFSFFNLANYKQNKFINVSEDYKKCLSAQTEIDMQANPVLGKGFNLQNGGYIALSKKSSMNIFNPRDSLLIIDFNIFPLANLTLRILVNDKLVYRSEMQTKAVTKFHLSLNKGYNNIKFVESSQNTIEPYFVLFNLKNNLPICKAL